MFQQKCVNIEHFLKENVKMTTMTLTPISSKQTMMSIVAGAEYDEMINEQ